MGGVGTYEHYAKIGGSGTHVTIVITSRYIFVSESPLLSLWYFFSLE